ncbi:class I SAM-dependent methyltransferase [Nocardia sp. NPDC020380]|uniref:class I SAM-dependent methyltransferase n=1 Tax=Nocardia sp. NPDC020380 TaxID=3364309 RepID=UPI0037B3ADDE
MDTVLRQTRKISGEGAFPHQFAYLLDNPVRRWLTDPTAPIEQLDLTGSEHVLELGPGPGFYSVELARRLPHGRLDLFDLQPEMLDKARGKLERAGYHNAEFQAGEAGAELPYPEATFDLAFLAAVIGEVPDRPACVRALHRVVKPGGTLVFLEGFGDPDRISEPELRRLAEPEGFEFLPTAGNTRWHDIVRFRRAA